MVYSLVLPLVLIGSSVSELPASWGSATVGRALEKGADVLAIDPAAAGVADGLELSVRMGLGEESFSSWSSYAVLPGAFFSLYGGYEKGALGGPSRTTVGGSVALTESTWLGLAYRSLDKGNHPWDGISSWDLGLYAEPYPWLSLSLGLDQMNRPAIGGKQRNPITAMGIGVRPLAGASWLEIGGDIRARFKTGANWSGDLLEWRTVLGVAPIPGLKLQGAYIDAGSEATFWAGLSVDIFEHVEMTTESSDWNQGSNVAMGVTLREKAKRSWSTLGNRSVQLSIQGNLMRSQNSWLEPAAVLSTLSLELDEAAKNSRIARVILKIGKLQASLADVDELRSKIAYLRKNGKRVEAHLSVVEDKGYLVAAAADVIFMDPMGQLTLDGFAVTRRYLGDSFEKVGVQFEAVAIGDYKTGPDAFIRNASRPVEREMSARILDEAYSTLRAAVMKDRKLSAEAFTTLLAEAQFSASRALELGLVDELTGSPKPNTVPKELRGGVSVESLRLGRETWGVANKVMVIPVVGTLMMSGGINPFLGKSVTVDDVLPFIEEARRRDDIKAVVLRVDSPGGELMAAELIWRAIRRLGEVKPVITSMGSVAASGGYYIAAPTHRILAQPNTITGSIGIFSLRPNLKGLYDWVGIRNETTQRGPQADFGNDTHALTPQGRARLEKSLKGYYDIFVGKVAAGRRLTKDKANEIAQGQIFSGRQARTNGLVDEFGGMSEAVDVAKRLAGIADLGDVQIVIAKPQFNLSNALTGLVRGPQSVKEGLQEWMTALEQWDSKILALMPAVYEVGR